LYDGRRLGDWVPAVVNHLRERFEPVQVVLFGSVARHEEGPDSDIDLLVVLPEVSDPLQAMAEMLNALDDFPVPIDVWPIDTAGLEQARQLPSSLVAQALTEGQVVYDRSL
jgi:predicted nucleotidyltransferase